MQTFLKNIAIDNKFFLAVEKFIKNFLPDKKSLIKNAVCNCKNFLKLLL